MKRKIITEQTEIIEALEINPKAENILAEAGLGCLGCAMASFESLEQGLSAHGFSKKEIKKLIEEMNK